MCDWVLTQISSASAVNQSARCTSRSMVTARRSAHEARLLSQNSKKPFMWSGAEMT